MQNWFVSFWNGFPKSVKIYYDGLEKLITGFSIDTKISLQENVISLNLKKKEKEKK